MAKKQEIKASNRQNPDPIVKILADKWGLSPRQIRYIRDGEFRNDAVFSDYMDLLEHWRTGVKNLFLQEVERIVPIHKTPKSHNTPKSTK